MKKKPVEFYEVSYFEATCLLIEAQKLDKQGNKSDAAEKAKKGQQILKYNLFQNAKLTGPDMVAKYKKLIDQLDLLQGRKPSSTTKKPATSGKESSTKKD
jgi:hypothetical protein